MPRPFEMERHEEDNPCPLPLEPSLSGFKVILIWARTEASISKYWPGRCMVLTFTGGDAIVSSREEKEPQ
jgi:hypothetical protein